MALATCSAHARSQLAGLHSRPALIPCIGAALELEPTEKAYVREQPDGDVTGAAAAAGYLHHRRAPPPESDSRRLPSINALSCLLRSAVHA